MRPTDPRELKRKKERTRREVGAARVSAGRTKAVVLAPVLESQTRRRRGAERGLTILSARRKRVSMRRSVLPPPSISRSRRAGSCRCPIRGRRRYSAQAKSRNSPGLIRAEEAELVIVDHPLTPVQQRNLETAWDAKVLDRTGLILEIFGQRARTREGRLQVELAHLVYQKSRLVRSWTHLERQRGGFGFLGGPGETQIETDRRLIGERIDVIRKELEQVKRTRFAASEIARARAVSLSRAGRLHQRRQIDAVQCADRRLSARREHAVRYARPDHPRAAASRRLQGRAFGHGRLHLRSADHA